MHPTASTAIIFVIISIASLFTISCVTIIALGSSGVFSSKSHHTRGTSILNTISTLTGATSSILPSVTSTTTLSSVPNVTTTVSSTATLSNTVSVSPTTATNLVAVSALNDVLLYPNGSYSDSLSSLTRTAGTLALIPLTQSVIDEIGGVDNSSTIMEAGRTQYLYFHVVNDTADASSSLTSISTVKRSIDHVRSPRFIIGSNIVTGLAIHFGNNSNDSSIIIIPILNTTYNVGIISPGVFLYNLIDGSVVIRIEISVPASLCPLYNGLPIDLCLSISYQAYAIFNYNQITAALLVDVQMACGDVCALPTNLCSISCTTCAGQQVAGYDTPVTRRYDMGATTGTFEFYYETYFIRDRITVWNGATLLLDTGCVGATDTVQLSYSSASSYIRVNVEPNCACSVPTGCGTVWIFTVNCLNSTSSSRSVRSIKQIISDRTVNLSLSDKLEFERRLNANRNRL